MHIVIVKLVLVVVDVKMNTLDAHRPAYLMIVMGVMSVGTLNVQIVEEVNDAVSHKYGNIIIYALFLATAVTLTRKDCPPGLRFNLALTRCDYSRNVKC